MNIDYSTKINWLNAPGMSDSSYIGKEKVDLFYLYPTCYFTEEGDFCLVSNLGMRNEALKIREAHFGIFKGTNVYAPFYRQFGLSYFEKLNSLKNIDHEVARIPAVDVKNAFEYYLKNYNNGHPIIFASHSQGTIIMRHLLRLIREEHPEILDRMIAAYLIGFSIDEDFINEVELSFAESANDTGVVISYNTEQRNAAINPLIFVNHKKSLAINPVNWRRDAVYASKEESAGSFIRFGANMPVTIHNFADASLDLKRGSVVTNADIDSGNFWPDGVLHRYDYDLFYYDLKKNLTDRINAWYVTH